MSQDFSKQDSIEHEEYCDSERSNSKGEKMSNLDKFCKLYVSIERLAKKMFKNDDSEWMTALTRYFDGKKLDFSKELYFCKTLRNFNAHNGTFDIQPNDVIIKFLEYVKKELENPKKAIDFCRRRDAVITASMESPVLPIMRIMYSEKYTHIPVVGNDCVFGAFSANTLLAKIVKEPDFRIAETTTIWDFSDYLSVEKSGASEVIRFAKQDDTYFDIKRMFQDFYQKDERLGMILVTENGKRAESLLGIITVSELLDVIIT